MKDLSYLKAKTDYGLEPMEDEEWLAVRHVVEECRLFFSEIQVYYIKSLIYDPPNKKELKIRIPSRQAWVDLSHWGLQKALDTLKYKYKWDTEWEEI